MNLFEQKLKKEYDALVKAMAQLKKSLEDETIARVDLENRMQSLREDLAFKAQIHEQVRLLYIIQISELSSLLVCIL